MSISIGGFRRARDLVKKLLSQDPKSARSQVSVALFHVRTFKSVRAWICADDVHVSRLQAKNRQHHPGPERRRGGGKLEGFVRTPLLTSKRFYILVPYRWKVGPLVVSVLLRIIAV